VDRVVVVVDGSIVGYEFLPPPAPVVGWIALSSGHSLPFFNASHRLDMGGRKHRTVGPVATAELLLQDLVSACGSCSVDPLPVTLGHAPGRCDELLKGFWSGLSLRRSH
jgi:hypothetical protein